MKLADEAARRRITAELKTGLAVEAAAGTGKTTEMVNRIISLVEAGVRMREMAAITFTENAAAELEERVRAGLEKRLGESKGKTTERIKQALSELDDAQISTIHAFAFTLIKERPAEAGVDPESRVMEELEAELWTTEFWEQWLAGLAPEEAEILLQGVRRGLKVRIQKGVRRGLNVKLQKELARQLSLNRDVAAVLREELRSRPAVGVEDIRAKLQALANEAASLREELEAALKDKSDKGYLHVEAFVEKLREVLTIESAEEFLEAVNGMEEPQSKEGKKESYRSPELNERRRNKMKEFRGQLEEIQKWIRVLWFEQVLEILCGFAESDWEARRRAGRLNFQDLLLQAVQVLQEPEAQAYYRQRFKHILVDEFQDTDPLQVEMIELLAGGRPDALFIVGDPKQSIYRFRRADISIYSWEVKELCQRTGQKPVLLTTNFRSVPGIIKWVNSVFPALMMVREPYQTNYVQMTPARPALSGRGVLPPVSVLQPADNEILSANVDKIRTAEAEAVAALIQHLTSGSYQVQDPLTAELISLRFRHIAVLFFQRPQENRRWLASFNKRGIPVVSDLTPHFLQETETAGLRAAIRAIEDPDDSLSLFAALRSPLFGLSDEELFLAAQQSGGLDYRRDVSDPPELQKAYQLFRHLHEKRRRQPALATIEELLQASGLRLSSVVFHRDDTGVRFLDRFLDLVRAFQRLEGDDFAELVSHLDDLAAFQQESREPITLEPEEDAVRMCSVHQAKGLEFPVVILANLNARLFPRRGDVELLIERVKRKRAASRAGKFFFSRFYNELNEDEKKHQEAEKVRLFYVAATRARDALILSVFAQDSGSSKSREEKKPAHYFDLLPDDLRRWSPQNFGRTVEGVYFWDAASLPGTSSPGRVKEKTEESAPLPSLRDFLKKREKTLAAAQRGLVLHSPTREKKKAEERERITALRKKKTEQSEEDSAQALGRLVHEILEAVDIDAEQEKLERVVRARARKPDVEGKEAEIFRLVSACLKSPAVRRAVASGQWWLEVPYTIWRGEEVHEGRLDLVFREGERVVVVDYKTDRIPPEAVKARAQLYADQAAEYRRAAKEAINTEEIEVRLVFASPGREVLLSTDGGVSEVIEIE